MTKTITIIIAALMFASVASAGLIRAIPAKPIVVPKAVKSVIVCANTQTGALCVSRRTDGSDAGQIVRRVLVFANTPTGMIGVWRSTGAHGRIPSHKINGIIVK